MHQRTRAHCARFNCSKQFAVPKAVVAYSGAGFAQGNDFGVGRGIGVGEIAVPAAANYPSIADRYRTDGNLTCFQGAVGSAQSLFHPEFV